MNSISDLDPRDPVEPGRTADMRRSPAGATNLPPWEVLLVDHSADIRDSLRAAVDEMQVERRTLQLVEARSAPEARRWLDAHPDVALVVLGVETETESAGLELVRHIRHDLANRRAQIMIVARHPGIAPWRQVIIENQIDEYQMKSALTADRMFVSVFNALSAFHAQLQVHIQRGLLESMGAELREREARVRAVIEAAPDAIVLVDGEGLVTGWNSGARDLFGCTGQQMHGRALARAKREPRRGGAGNVALTDLDLDELPRLRGTWKEAQGLRQDGERVAVELAVGAWRSASGLNYSVFIRDISDRKRHEEEIRQLALHDPLTELPNRRLLLDRLARTIARCQRSSCLGAVLVVDLDNFKSLNDTHGHDLGDLFLVESARRMKRCVRRIDTVGRLGGDEFLVVLGDLSVDPNRAALQAFRVADEIRSAIAQPWEVRLPQPGAVKIECHCTATIGVALVNAESDWDTLFHEADTAMYAAKEAGRNAVRLLDAAKRLPAAMNGARIIRLPRHAAKAGDDDDRS